VPPIVLARAKAKLTELEAKVERGSVPQIPLFEPEATTVSEAEATLRALDVDTMTPVDALVTLARLVELARRNEE
jgi:DNA mismatch repair ATPase MutS